MPQPRRNRSASMFYGAGLVVFPVVLIYTVAVYWIFRGKVHDADAIIAGRQSD